MNLDINCRFNDKAYLCIDTNWPTDNEELIELGCCYDNPINHEDSVKNQMSLIRK